MRASLAFLCCTCALTALGALHNEETLAPPQQQLQQLRGVEPRPQLSAAAEEARQLQIGQGQGQGQGQKLRGRKRRIDRPKKAIAGAENTRLKAMTVTYPLNLFGLEVRNWRTPARYVFCTRYCELFCLNESHFCSSYRYSKELVSLSPGQDKPYLELAHAQDQEDVWLYENWFYGMKNGVIMESGALNGLLFSTSYMFENYASWTAIHVGRCSSTSEVLMMYCLSSIFHNRGRSRELRQFAAES